MHCRTSGSLRPAPRLDGHGSNSTDNGMERQSEFCDDQNVSFSVVASVDARTLPLALLQSDHLYLLVADMSEHCNGNGSVADAVSEIDSSFGDFSFEQLMMQLAQLQLMLVSVLAGFNLIE